MPSSKVDRLTSRFKTITCRSSLRSGLQMWAGSRSPAATSSGIGVKRLKLSLLISVTSTSARFAAVRSRYRGRLYPGESAAQNNDLCFLSFPSDFVHVTTSSLEVSIVRRTVQSVIPHCSSSSATRGGS